jgi:CBS domain-containing protein
MQVAEILRAKGNRVITMRPETPVSTVIHRFKLDHIGAVVISTDGNRIDGLLSERDIVLGLIEHGAGLLQRQAGEVMVREVATCTPADSIKQLMAKMTHGRIRHLPVVENGKLAGIVSIGDVVKYRLQEAELEATVLREAYIAAH